MLRIVSKEEAHKIIDDVPGNTLMILTFNNNIGISNYGRKVKKKKSKKIIEKYPIIILSESVPITTLNLHKIENRISECIIIPKME